MPTESSGFVEGSNGKVWSSVMSAGDNKGLWWIKRQNGIFVDKTLLSVVKYCSIKNVPTLFIFW